MILTQLIQSIAGGFKTAYSSFLHLAYPTRCLHCRTMLAPTSLVLCEVCGSLLELLKFDERCLICFSPLSSPLCEQCLHYPSLYNRAAAAFLNEGPAASLVKRLPHQSYLAPGMAAYLVVQLENLQWPWPDALVPIPLQWGESPNALLAEAMSQLLQRPVWYALKRRDDSFYLHPSYSLQNKNLLVIHFAMQADFILHACAEALSAQQPASMYALTFCQTF